LSYHRASEATPMSGAASMTVCTNDLALCHLVEDALPVTIPQALCDAEFLVPEMVELQDHGVGLPAVQAWMFTKKSDQVLDAFGGDGALPSLSLIDVSPAIRQVVLALVVGPAGPAVVVALAECFAAPGEVLKRLFQMAAPTSPHG
jgi:hypothetical protein